MPFVKGRSGNPGGRIKPERRLVIDAMMAELNVKEPEQAAKNARRLAHTAVKEAIAGDVGWARLLMEYVYGKPVQPVDVEVRAYAEQVAGVIGADASDIISLAERRKAS